MKTHTQSSPDVFPEGTEVGAYPESNWPLHGPPSGAPLGEAAEEATVEDGSATFTSLLAGTTYWLVGEVGEDDYRYVKVVTEPVDHVAIAATSDGDNTVVAAVAGKLIRVLGYAINVNKAGVAKFQDSAGSPEVFAQFDFPEGGGATYSGGRDNPAFEVARGQGLEVSVEAGVDATGHLTYELA